jgi:Protein of unknown function (DUF2950)
MQTMKTFFSILFLLFTASALSAAQMGKTFDTPQKAVTALGQAVDVTNRAELVTLFGDETERLTNPDTVQGAQELADFATAFNATNRLVPDSDKRMILEVGNNGWPFPIPLVKTPDGWRFDATAGVDEILNRRIGRNELDVLRVMRAYVEAQREYAGRDRDGDQVLEYAQHILSAPGSKDGLYWSPNLDGELSPLGPLVAVAQSEGYAKGSGEKSGPRPFHGYLFKILTRQGASAPGGKYDYVINGNMIGGFALVAWPVAYGDSAIMTFIVNQQGRVYQKDFGANTAKLVQNITAYDPDSSWRISAD